MIMTLLLFLTTAVCFTAEKRMEPMKQGRQTDVAFRIPAGDREEEISWWSEDNEHAFVFLPSYAELKDISVILGNGIHAMIGDETLSDGMDCGAFNLDTDYEMVIQDQNPMKLRFVRSGNLPTMFIHTVSGTEEIIHTQRNVWEYAQLCLVDAEGKIDYQDEPTITQIPCNGDFRSQICIDMLKEADIVVTNPPFSLFREYVAQLIEYDKKFLIIGHQNAIKYKEIFPLIKNNQLWLGYGFPGNVGFFRAPHYEDYAVSSQHKEGLIRVSGVMWFTNLDIPKRHQNLDLRGNYYRSSDYPKYYNLDAIDVGKVENIPCDFDGMMGVPITFMQNYNPDQFEIIGCSDVADSIPNVDILGQEWIAGYRAQGGTGHYTANMKSVGLIKPKYKIIFSRIMIRNKNPEPRRYPDED